MTIILEKKAEIFNYLKENNISCGHRIFVLIAQTIKLFVLNKHMLSNKHDKRTLHALGELADNREKHIRILKQKFYSDYELFKRVLKYTNTTLKTQI